VRRKRLAGDFSGENWGAGVSAGTGPGLLRKRRGEKREKNAPPAAAKASSPNAQAAQEEQEEADPHGQHESRPGATTMMIQRKANPGRDRRHSDRQHSTGWSRFRRVDRTITAD